MNAENLSIFSKECNRPLSILKTVRPQAIKDLLNRKFQDVEHAFHDLDESNTRRLTQEMMYQLLRR